MKKILATVAALSVVVGIIAGCSKPASQTNDPATPAQPKKVTIQFWTIALKPTFEEYINGVIKAYQAKNTNVTVQWTDLPFGSIQDKLVSAVAADEAPDVVNLNTELAVLMASKGALAPMEDLVKPEQKAVYFEKLYNSAQYQGKTYALPWYAGGETMFMNTDIMKKAGLDPQNPPKTWDELSAAAKAIKDKIGLDAFVPQGDMNRFFQDGVPILSTDKKKAAFNTPDGVAAVKWYADLFQKNIISKDLVGKSYADGLNFFMGGQQAFVLTGPNFLKRVQEQSADIYKVTDVAEYPVGKQRVDQLPLMDLVVPQKSKIKKEAADFALFVTNDENQLGFSKIVSILPSTKKAAQDEFFKAKGNTVEDKAKEMIVKQLDSGADLALGIGLKQSDVSAAITDAFQAAATGKSSPEQAVKDAEKKVNDILAKP